MADIKNGLVKLFKLANSLDRIGHQLVADEVDNIIKSALPRSDEEIDKSVEEYFADPERQERHQVEKEYGLYDDEDSFGLEPAPWHGHKWSYEGFPKDKSEDAKKFERYQTVISDDSNLPEQIDDPVEGGIWVREQTYEKPAGATKGNFRVVYRFVDPAEEKRKKELWGDDDISPELKSFLDKVDREEAVETPEAPEDVVETEEPKQHGGGVKLF